MSNNTIKNKVKKELDDQSVLVNKIAFSGVSKEERQCIIRKTILSLEAPNDDDIARVLRARENLEEIGIVLETVLLEL